MYAVISPVLFVGMKYVERCVPCPEGSTGLGDRAENCVCNLGFSMTKSIQDIFGDNIKVAFELEDGKNFSSICISCRELVYVQNNANNIMRHEAISCPLRATPIRCAGLYYVHPTTHVCTLCGDGFIPTLGRDGCYQCAIGKKRLYRADYDYYTCGECDAATTYQDEVGQVVCKPKKTHDMCQVRQRRVFCVLFCGTNF